MLSLPGPSPAAALRPLRRRALPALACLALLAGCSRFRPHLSAEYVYVTAKQTSLRDRVAAVSNRTGTVDNGERLEVLEHGRRYLRVKTPAGETGWISDRVVATQQTYDAFQSLAAERKSSPAVATAVVRDEVNMHLRPGRDTDVFYQLPEGDKLQLLARATLPKPVAGGAAPAKPSAVTLAKPSAAASPAKPSAAAQKKTSPTTASEASDTAAAPLAMEDWWLARDAQGHIGWLLSRMIDVDAPDALTRYAEGQRIIGAYVLTHVNDPGAGDDQPDKNIPVYLTVIAPYKAGLPYDFDQVRLFTWNAKMHRYETGFRDKNIEGYLPVTITTAKDPYGKAAAAETPAPTFTYRVLAADAPTPAPDPVTGMLNPGRLLSKTYRLEGNVTRRIAPPGSKDEPEAHPAPEEKKEKPAAKKRR